MVGMGSWRDAGELAEVGKETRQREAGAGGERHVGWGAQSREGVGVAQPLEEVGTRPGHA